MNDHIAISTATQVQRPWRTLVRTVFQGIVGFAPLVPLIVAASGVDETLGAVAAGIAVSGAITRIMALPGVESWLARFVPLLAADPQ
ncbi:MAG: hypothetical protein ACOH10_15055 [Rhodoglobus sp.]